MPDETEKITKTRYKIYELAHSRILTAEKEEDVKILIEVPLPSALGFDTPEEAEKHLEDNAKKYCGSEFTILPVKIIPIVLD